MNAPPHGSLRARVLAGHRLSAAFISIPSPDMVEIAAHAGFDFAVIDTEHGPMAISDIAHMLRAADAARMPALVRVPTASKEHVLRALDAGAAGILVPQVESAAQAADAVREAHYPPNGQRGAAFYARAHQYTKNGGAQALARSDAATVVGVIVETPAGVANAREIAAVPGIDFLFLGTSDLSICLGDTPGAAAELKAAIAHVAAVGRELSRTTGIAVTGIEQGRGHAADGFRLIGTSLPGLLLRESARFCAGLSSQ